MAMCMRTKLIRNQHFNMPSILPKTFVARVVYLIMCVCTRTSNNTPPPRFVQNTPELASRTTFHSAFTHFPGAAGSTQPKRQYNSRKCISHTISH